MSLPIDKKKPLKPDALTELYRDLDRSQLMRQGQTFSEVREQVIRAYDEPGD